MVPGSETAPALAGLEEVLAPVVVEVRADPLATAKLGYALLATEAMQDDADLLFGGVLAAGLALDLSYDLLGTALPAHRTLLSWVQSNQECPLTSGLKLSHFS